MGKKKSLWEKLLMSVVFLIFVHPKLKEPAEPALPENNLYRSKSRQDLNACITAILGPAATAQHY